MKHHLLCAAALVGSLTLFVPPGAQAQNPRPPVDSRFVQWSFQADFSHGFTGWESYPLAQDVGFDPTISTSRENGKSFLLRSLKAEGQRVLHVGALRPLQFHATPASSFRWTYSLDTGGPVSRVSFIVADSDGTRHTALLPQAPGTHSIQISGSRLGIPAAGVDVQAIVIEANVDSPVRDSINRLAIRSFAVHAERPPEVPFQQPQVIRSAVDNVAVAEQTVSEHSPLRISVVSQNGVDVSLYDGSGAFVRSVKIPPSPGNRRTATAISLGNNPHPGLWRAELKSGLAHSAFRFLLLGKVPPHPRILLTRRRLAELHHLESSNDLLQAMHNKAKELRGTIQYNPQAGQNITLLPQDSPFPGVPEYFSLMENYSNAIAFNALDYRLNGNPAALESARRALLAVSEWPTWTPPWWIADGMHTYYEVGVFTQRIALGYDLIADQLSTSEKARITAAVWRNSIDPTVQEYFRYDRMPTAASNHMANSLGGAIAAAVALYGDVPAWNARLGAALGELVAAYEHLLAGLFPGDGSEAEPAGYEEFAMTGLSWGLAAFNALGIRPHGTSHLVQGFWWPRYAEVTPDLVLDSGDFDGRLRSLSGFAWEAEHENNPALRAFYDTAVNGVLGASRVTHTGRKLEEAPGPLDLVCCTRPAVPVPEPPPSRIFPLRGSAVLRSGWKPTDTVISIRVGPWFNHEHHDQGTFQVAAFGEKLVSEAGYASYYKEPLYQSYFIQAPAHNTVLVDNNPFSQPGENGRYWKALAHYPRFTGHLLSPSLDFLSADLTPAYDARLTGFSREYLFLKPDVLIIHDTLHAPQPHRYSWLLHIPVADGHRVKGADAFIVGKNAQVTLTAAGANQHWQTVPTAIPFNDYGALDQIHLHRPFMFRIESARTTGTDFLVGMKFRKSQATESRLKEFSSSNGRGFTASGGGRTWQVLFRTHPGPLKCGSMATDGKIIAVAEQRGDVQEIFAAGFNRLTQVSAALLSASEKVNATLTQSPGRMRVRLFNHEATDIRIHVDRKPGAVTLDGKPASPKLERGYLQLERLRKGEHSINIRY